MEPPTGILSSLWRFILFIPYFTGLLLLGVLKGTNFHLIPILFDDGFIAFLPFIVAKVISFKSNFESFIRGFVNIYIPLSIRGFDLVN